MNVIHNLSASSIFNQLILRTHVALVLYCLATTQKKWEKYKKTKCKHQELADSKHCKEPCDLKMHQSTHVDAYIKIQDPCYMHIQ